MRPDRRGALGALLLLLGAASARAQPYEPTPLTVEGPPPPFERRVRRAAMKTLEVVGRGLTQLDRWPEEPEAPVATEAIDPRRFAAALATLCRNLRGDRPAIYTAALLAAAARDDVDPFLAAAVIFRMSRCQARAKGDFGLGLGGIDVAMHAGHVRDGAYVYHVLAEAGGWQVRGFPFPTRLTEAAIKPPTANIDATVALLAVHQAQCPENDGVFGSVPHRHFVSHYVWGDQVLGAGPEDRILTDRRRLIAYYTGAGEEPVPGCEGVALRAPLDGAPRKITSAMGDDRDRGARRHQGVDFESTVGEPVRAVADGVVSIAGVDQRGALTTPTAPKVARAVPPDQMGPGGLIVAIQHADGLTSYSMHLSQYFVEQGDAVTAGQIIGEVGRTGIKRSAAHLHFELRKGGRRLDPIDCLSPAVFAPDETYLGQRVARQQRKNRAARWRARRAREVDARGAN